MAPRNEESSQETIQETAQLRKRARDQPTPGVLLVFLQSRPVCAAFAPTTRVWTLGRGSHVEIFVRDERLSRRHAELTWDGAAFTVRDLDSRNGTFVDGARVHGSVRGGRVVRAGASVFLLLPDIRAFAYATVSDEGDVVIGPTLRSVWQEIEAHAKASPTLHVYGESGSGKELAARLYHKTACPPGSPFVALNCATIPTGLAESLLFGAKKGAYTGADRDTDGYIVAADGGTLFLDEVGELPLDVQAKLLRVLEAREVLPLGSAKARRVDVRLCSATLRDLRERAASGDFRSDLYFRLGRPAVRIPPLRERQEEIPWLAHASLQRADNKLTLLPTLVEQLLGRPWPGNVRELAAEVSEATRRAAALGEVVVSPEHLSSSAGQDLGRSEAMPDLATERAPRSAGGILDEDIEAALRTANGNVSRAAKALGLHRNQLRRWLQKKGLEARAFGAEDDATEP